MFIGIPEHWKLPIQIIFLVALCVVSIALINLARKRGSPTGNPRLEFRVDASGGYAIITLDAGSASISKPATVSVPWRKSLQIPSGTEVYLTASNPTQTGTLTCTIYLEQSLWKTETTTAPKDGVACAGIVP